MALAPIQPESQWIASVQEIEGDALPKFPNEITQPQVVRPLPGELDSTPVFNSNSPELIQREGILLSTFPPENMGQEDAHLDFPFEGRFDFFAHHVARGVNYDDRRTLFIGGVIYNPGSQPVTLEVVQGVSYLSQEAPFRNLPALVANPEGQAYAGPGSRTVTDFLQGRHQAQWPRRVTIPPRQAYLLMNAPIPLRRLPFQADATLPPGSILPASPGSRPSALVSTNVQGVNRQLPSNGRSVLLYLSSSGPVYAATLSMYAPLTQDGVERAPTLQEWLLLLVNGGLAGPRDIPPTDPEEFRKGNQNERFFYGRVSGVAQGSQWRAVATDESGAEQLTIPTPGNAISYVLSTVDHNTFGTEQIQSAPMLVRYPDTAYRAHGNYGVHYEITLPLYNNTDTQQRVALKLQSPLQDETLQSGLRFLRNPFNRIFFRGTVRVRYQTETGGEQTRYVHLVQRQGEEGDPFLRVNLPPQTRQNVVVELIYPPDATPPQVLTVTTLQSLDLITADSEEAPEAELLETGDLLEPEAPAVEAEFAPLEPGSPTSQDPETTAPEEISAPQSVQGRNTIPTNMDGAQSQPE
jgi:hypothetical protein